MNESGVITLIPTSGLGNRLRIMATAMKLAREGNKKLQIYWNRNSELNCQFEKLFELPPAISVKRIPFVFKIWIEMRRFSSKLFGFDEWYLNLFRFDFIFFDKMKRDVLDNNLDLQAEADKAKNAFICSCEEVELF